MPNTFVPSVMKYEVDSQLAMRMIGNVRTGDLNNSSV